jgi:hypothetical protein
MQSPRSQVSRKIETAKPFTTKDTKEHKGDDIRERKGVCFPPAEAINPFPAEISNKVDLMLQNPF